MSSPRARNMPKRLPLAERQDALRLILAGAKDDGIAAEIGCFSRTVATG